METRRIGSLDVSVVGIGTNNFGRRLDAAAAAAVVHAALDAGITHFDTADIYGQGQSETFLGRALAGRRDRAVIATKFGMEMPDGRGGSPEYLHRALDASLGRLGTDHVDLYWLHQPDPATPIEATLEAAADERRRGRIREFGVSNVSPEQLQDAVEAGDRVGIPVVAVQNEYSLLRREQAPVVDVAGRAGVGFVPYFPLASGVLTGKYRAGAPIPEGTRLAPGPTARPDTSRWLSDENLALVDRLDAWARDRGRSLLDVAFGWLLAQAPIASVIAGAMTPDQARANAAAAARPLSAADLREIDGIAGG